MAIPEATCHIEEYDLSDPIMRGDLPVIYPDAFEDDSIRDKIQEMCEEKGIQMIRDVRLHQLVTDKDRESKNERKDKENAFGM